MNFTSLLIFIANLNFRVKLKAEKEKVAVNVVCNLQVTFQYCFIEILQHYVMDNNIIGTHARFSEVVFSSLFASLYDLIIAENLYKLGELSWSIISSYYASEHSVNTLFIMAMGPSLLGSEYRNIENIWESRSSPLSSLRSHYSKISFLKNHDEFLNSLKEDLDKNTLDTLKRIGNVLQVKIGKEKMKNLGQFLEKLYRLRLFFNYEGIIISHQKRKEIEIYKTMREATEISLITTRKITKFCYETFIKWFKELLDSINPVVASAYVEHFKREVEEFNKLIRKSVRVSKHPILNQVKDDLGNLLMKYRHNQSRKEIIEGFMRQTYNFRIKQFLYQDFKDCTEELKELLRTKTL